MLPTILSRASLTIALSLFSACQGDTKSARTADTIPTTQSEPLAREASASTENNDDCPIKPRSFRHSAAERVVALGDLHGDLAATRRALRLAGAIDSEDRWVGGKLVLVQTGDILDRGDDEQDILDLFAALKIQAAAAGGAVHRLNGNHELMNAMGDFRYVTRHGFIDFAEPEVEPVPLTAELRAKAFLPGGSYAKRLAAFDIVTMVGDTVFVHGGVLPRFVDGIEESNRNARCYMLGYGAPPQVVMDPEGPLWSRMFSTGDAACDVLDKTLERLSAKRMVVGHTPQLGGITSACDGKVWRIDTGMASFYQGPTEVLEIRDAQVHILGR